VDYSIRGNRVAFYTALLLPESHAGYRFLLEHSAPEVDYIMASLHPEAELDESTYFRKIAQLKARGHNVIVRYVGNQHGWERWKRSTRAAVIWM
jgi:hypothetical protein